MLGGRYRSSYILDSMSRNPNIDDVFSNNNPCKDGKNWSPLDQDLRKWEFQNRIKCFEGAWIFQVLRDI